MVSLVWLWAARAHLGVDGEHLGGRYVPVDLAEVFDVGDERVGVGGHVRAEEAGPICDRVCHGGRGERQDHLALAARLSPSHFGFGCG
jgi:hypothetical protein